MSESSSNLPELSLKEHLRSEMKIALKNKNTLRLQTIRYLLSEIQYAEMAKKVDELSDSEIIQVIKTELKKRQEALEFAEKAARVPQIAEATEEITVLESFLPAQLSEEEIKVFINELFQDDEDVKNSKSPQGIVIKKLNTAYPNRVNGKFASEVINSILKSR
jgi:uncharacterized protein